MNPVAKELWLTALRSGEYEQGFEYLNYAGRLCCLGVLCEVAVKEGVVLPPVEKPRPFHEPVLAYGELREHQGLPEEVQEWAGLNEYPDLAESVEWFDPVEQKVYESTDLTQLNDSGVIDFLTIADAIEEQL